MSRAKATVLAATLLAAAAPASGQEPAAPLSADSFAERVTGRTLTYSTPGGAYGVEQYLPGRRVIWRFMDSECQRGVWYEAGDHICFVYDAVRTPQCWSFFEEGDGLRARFEGPGGGGDLVTVEESDAPLSCPGPQVGV